MRTHDKGSIQYCHSQTMYTYASDEPNKKRECYTHIHPNITQVHQGDETVETVPANMDEKEEEIIRLPQFQRHLSINMLHHNKNPLTTGISQASLITFRDNLYIEEISNMARINLDPLEIEQIINGVVHPVTKETITKYK